MLHYDNVKNKRFDDIPFAYTKRDTMLYALGLGVGQDPMDRVALRFVYEKALQAIPTMGAVMGSVGLWMGAPEFGADVVKLVHGEQDMRFLKPLPVEGRVIARNKVLSVTDKGAGKGAIILLGRDLIDQASGDKLIEIRQVSFLRGDGGFSAEHGKSDPAPEALPAVPERAADLERLVTVRPEAALIYRLSGDYNPLHADPDAAAKAGFKQPILHGLCTYGMGARAVIEGLLGGDPTRLKRLAVRFTSPVFPGDTIRYELWRESESRYSLRATVDARNVAVMNNGVVEIA